MNIITCDVSILCIYTPNSYSIITSSSTVLSCGDNYISHDPEIPIECPSEHDCIILCMQSDSCQSLIINCPTNATKNCHLQCLDNLSCAMSTIYSSYSNELIIDCDGYHSCQNIDIYCPLTQTISELEEDRKCRIRGSDTSIHTNLTLYTQYGFDDIDMSQYIAQINLDSNHNMMHCNIHHTQYNDTCLISSVSWNCIHSHHPCNGILSKYDIYNTTLDIFEMELTLITEPSQQSDNTATLAISAGVVIILIICVICCICACTQYRRKQEDLYKLKEKEQRKSELYGGDDVFDDTLYADEADETMQFTTTTMSIQKQSTMEEVDIDEEIEIAMNEK